jgi:hypothetical protein
MSKCAIKVYTMGKCSLDGLESHKSCGGPNVIFLTVLNKKKDFICMFIETWKKLYKKRVANI